MNVRNQAASNLSSSSHHYVANFQTDIVEFLAIATQLHHNPSSDAKSYTDKERPAGAPVPIQQDSQT